MPCRALLIASQPDDDVMEVRAISAAGVEWGSSAIRYEGWSPIPAKVWLLTPLTVLGDLPVMAGELVLLATVYAILVPALIAS